MSQGPTVADPPARRTGRPGPGAAQTSGPDRLAGPGLVRQVALLAILSGITILAFSLIFPPRSLWPLAFVCLVPWMVAICIAQRGWMVHLVSFLAGWTFFLVNLSWLRPVTGLGYAALAFYLAIYWPMAAWAVRTGRRYGIGCTWTLPIVWVACEYLRAWVMTGFPWLFLAHALYRQLALIQISDLTGAYGVSFLVALVNGWLSELVVGRVGGRPGPWRRRLLPGLLAVIVGIGATWGYGRYRLSQATLLQGPRLAVIQQDYPQVTTPPYGENYLVMLASYLALAAQAAQESPDLIVFPETAWSATQNISFIEQGAGVADSESKAAWPFGKFCHEVTADFARGDYRAVRERFERLAVDAALRARLPGGRWPAMPDRGPATTLVVGCVSVELYPQQVYPREKRFNSAVVYDADGSQRRERYDKNHLVPFGEYVPFRDARVAGIHLHWLYRWLNSLSPFSHGGRTEYSLWPGRELTVFELETAQGRTRFGTPICYEDVMPYLIRRYVHGGRDKRVDFLINLSNDGWFLHSAELPQHLAICVFRAVENRVGIARAVNTGMSGFINPNGRIDSLVQRDGRALGAGVVGYRVDHVWLDRRISAYTRWGDWLAAACLALSALLWFGAICTRWLASLYRHLMPRHGGTHAS